MPTFEWKGTRAGQTQTGVLTADNKDAAITMLRRAPQTEHTIDWLGAGLLAGGTASLLLGLVWGGRQYGWTSAHVLAALGAAVVLLVAFAFVERRSPEPILPFDVLRNPIVASSVVCMALVGVVMFARSRTSRCSCRA